MSVKGLTDQQTTTQQFLLDNCAHAKRHLASFGAV
jgi:hypothetical protein